jgi:hypothetical protein
MRPALLLLLAGCAGAPPARDTAPVAPKQEAAAPAPVACGMDVRRLVSEELARRPLAGDDDVYAIVRQAVLGSGESVPDPVRGQALLAKELERVGPPVPGEPIVEDLDETSGTVRLNLRKWKFVRGTAAELWPVVVGSLRELPYEPARMPPCLEGAASALEHLGRDPAPLRARVSELAGRGYPPVPQTPAYVEAYRPQYRVVLRRLLPPWVTAPPPDAG